MKYNLISELKAQETSSSNNQEQFSFASFIPLILIFVVFYFLIIRPQTKKMKQHQQMVESLKIGDKIITNSGVLGKVVDIIKEENVVEVEIAKDVTVRIIRNFVSEVVDKKESNKKSKK